MRELSFRATRDGLDGQLLLNGALRPVREEALNAVAIASAYAADLGCWEELMLVHRLLERGNGAARQRANATAGGVELMLRRGRGGRPSAPLRPHSRRLPPRGSARG